MKKLEDYKGQKIAIHFPTYELWLRRKEINPSDDLKDENWNINKENTVYYFDQSISGQFGNLNRTKDYGFDVLPATDFLEEEFIYGEEYEFSDDESFKGFAKRQFLCKSPDDKYFITWNKESEIEAKWRYARKINTERSEAITTIKELVSKFSINKNEVF